MTRPGTGTDTLIFNRLDKAVPIGLQTIPSQPQKWDSIQQHTFKFSNRHQMAGKACSKSEGPFKGKCFQSKDFLLLFALRVNVISGEKNV